MELVLTPVEARVLGCLVEKEATTPDSYPLSLNALRTACNQKSNRDPVMDLAEDTVTAAVDSLVKKTLVAARSGAGSRVIKHAHRLQDRLRPDFDFPPAELALMAVLMLRGPQTPGELKGRCARLHAFPDVDTVVAALERLAARDDGPYVVALARQPGQKESRYAHLVCGEPDESMISAPIATGAPLDDNSARIAELEHAVGEMRREIADLSERFVAFKKQFE